MTFSVGFLILMPLYIGLVLYINMRAQGVRYCLADAYCDEEMYCKIGAIPYAAFLVVQMIKYDFLPTVVVRMKSVRMLWIRLCKKIVLNAFLLTVYLFLFTTLIGMHFGQFYNNWSENNSAAYHLLHTQVPQDGNVWEIMVVFLTVTFLTIAVFGMLIALIWWIVGIPLVGYAFMILLIELEIGLTPPATHLYFAKVNLNPVTVYWSGISYQNMVLYPFCVLVALFFVGLVFIRRKNFL